MYRSLNRERGYQAVILHVHPGFVWQFSSEVPARAEEGCGFANFNMMTSYHRSLGHLPVDPDLIEVVKSCAQLGEHCESKDPKCPHVLRRQVFRADLVVNTTLLRGAFEEAAAKVCACS